MKKQIYGLMAVVLFLGLMAVSNSVSAQVATTTDEISHEIIADDLGINEPNVLPDSPWYGLKKFWEGVRDVFTFNPVVKAENSLNRASTRLIEMQKLIEEGKIKDADKVIAQYEKQIDQVKSRIEKLTDIQSDKTSKFLDKFAEYQLKHRLILEKIAESSDMPLEIDAAKEKALSILSEALTKTDNEKLQERLEKAIEKVEGSDLKEFKNLEVLKALEDKVPENARPAILKAQVNVLKRLKIDIDQLPVAQRTELIQKFLAESRGDGARYLEALDELIANDNLPREIIGQIPELRLKLQERVRNEEQEDQDNVETKSDDLNGQVDSQETEAVEDESDSNDNQNSEQKGRR